MSLTELHIPRKSCLLPGFVGALGLGYLSQWCRKSVAVDRKSLIRPIQLQPLFPLHVQHGQEIADNSYGSKFLLNAALPPLPTIAAISLIGMLPCIPSAFRNSPTAFLLTSVLANFGAIPARSPIYGAITGLAPYAVALLLLSPKTDHTSTHNTKPAPYALVFPFLIGALATFVAALIPPLILPPGLPSSQLFALLAAFAATYIGGSLNFIAVAQTLALSSHLSAAAIAVDLVLMAIYFAVLFLIAARLPFKSRTQPLSIDSRASINPISIATLPVPIVLVFILVFVCEKIVSLLKLPSTNTLILTSLGAVIFSRIRVIQPLLATAPLLATLFLNLFFAALGATAQISDVLSASPTVLCCATIVLVIHASLLYLLGRLVFRIPAHHLLIASNANIGGATTAPVYAAACGWQSHVSAAVVAGTLGYIIGTPAALLVYRILNIIHST